MVTRTLLAETLGLAANMLENPALRSELLRPYSETWICHWLSCLKIAACGSVGNQPTLIDEIVNEASFQAAIMQGIMFPQSSRATLPLEAEIGILRAAADKLRTEQRQFAS